MTGLMRTDRSSNGRVLVVDDDPTQLALIESGLTARGLTVSTETSAEGAIGTLGREDFDAILSDLFMTGMNGIELCRRLARERPALPIVVMTAYGDVATAVSAIRAGAYDFVEKPINLDALKLTISRAVEHRRLEHEVKRLRAEAGGKSAMDELLGTSASMSAVREMIDRISDSDASVLISGESGTGKEVVARLLHKTGRRSGGPFVAVNCAAIPEPLLESELFGHVKGAFTDARTTRPGLLVQSSGGTLFLDEIGDMPLGLQPKLLRALQDRRVRPVGGDGEIPFDARIVSATHRDIHSAVEERLFREDLFFRINVIHIELPPLRARGADALLLSQRFIETLPKAKGVRVSGLSRAAAKKIAAYPWPGNVRELMNCIERALAITRSTEIEMEDLPDRVREYQASHVLVASNDPSDLLPLEEVERRYIERVLEASGGNKSTAAKILRVDRKTLYRKLTRFGLSEKSDNDDGST